MTNDSNPQIFAVEHRGVKSIALHKQGDAPSAVAAAWLSIDGNTQVAEFSLMVGLSRIGAGFGIVGLAVLGGGLVSSAYAESFYLKNGQVIEGKVLRGTLNTLTLEATDGVHLTSIGQIERVALTLADGSEIAGELLSWKGGVYELRSDGEVLRVANGEVQRFPAGNAPAATASVTADDADTEAPTETIAMRSLPSFTLKNGELLVGKILHATGSVLTVRPEGGTALPISRAQIEEVTFEGENGEVISGKLINWKSGVYRLQLDDRELLANLPDDRANASSQLQQAATDDQAVEPSDGPAASEAEQADAALSPPSDAEAPSGNANEPSTREVGAGGPANETAIAALKAEEPSDNAADAVADGQHLVETQVEPVDEDSTTVLFRFQLNKPAERPLIVLYAATDASAKAGEDFEAKSGVITFAAGSTYAEVEVPIIDDDRGEDSEEFNLFLSGDPETITFSQRQVAAIINDND